MTFYWWSHWFWITLLSNILLPIIVVQTYPSQEISLEYNQNIKDGKTTVTKLYQTTTTLTWATAAPPNDKYIGVTAEKTILQNVSPAEISSDDSDDDDDDDDEELLSTTAEMDDDDDDVDDSIVKREQEDQHEDVEASASEEYEYKRSADNYNSTVESDKAAEMTKAGRDNDKVVVNSDDTMDASTASKDAPAASPKLKREEALGNNYTNFSSAESVLNQTTNNTNSTSSLTGFNATDRDPIKSSTTAAPVTDAAPSSQNDPSAEAALQWFNALAQLPPTVTDDSATADSETIAVAQKAPFTLENANKPDVLQRAESEQGSRKSKVLSADYKHINRFINFSTDSKSLLTRSASTAPNEFDGDEGNISSEALAIQRTYFLDAGAISAICFTIFGVCCTVGTIGIVLYRRRYLNKPQALSEPDSSVYIDDSTMRVSDNSDEMYSLDNDSFLNSLEAMTIQNYWTDTVKHTKL